jgi:hypothetical protein
LDSDAPQARLVVAIPVFNDWAVVQELLRGLDGALAAREMQARVLIIDDASTEPAPDALDAFTALSAVEAVTLRRNLGHQRAIAIGLAFIEAQRPCDMVVVMDGDGEDLPADVPRLVDKCRESGGTTVVFAARARRSESLWFRLGYAAFKAIHRVLTGTPVRVGNFSLVPWSQLQRLVVVSEVWNHYAAAVFKARLPRDYVETSRGRRLGGRSSMSFVTMVVHGLSAIAVYGEVVGVRLLCATAIIVTLVAAACIAALGWTLAMGIALPTWATIASGALLVVASQATVMSFVFVFIVLSSRAGVSFLPIRDYGYFVSHVRALTAPSTD